MIGDDEHGPIPWRWRNLLHWQRVHADDLFELQLLLESIRKWLFVIAVLLLILIMVVILS